MSQALTIYNKDVMPMFWFLDIVLDKMSPATVNDIIYAMRSEAAAGIIVDHINGRAKGLTNPRNLQRMTTLENSEKASGKRDNRPERKKQMWRDIQNALKNMGDFQ